MMFNYKNYISVNHLLNRNLRRFPSIEKFIAKVLKSLDIDANYSAFLPNEMKYMEGCIEAPLQICLQMYIFLAGQWPGNYDIILMA